MKQLLSLFVRPKRALIKQETIEEEQPTKLQELQASEVQEILEGLKIENIRRVMLLLNIQWINQDGTTFSPDEREITGEVLHLINNAVGSGRKQGSAVVRNRGFTVEYGVSRKLHELVGVTYVLSAASNYPKITELK